LEVRNSCEAHKTAPVLVFGEEFEWTRDVVSKGVVEMERIRWKGLPSWFIFLSLAFGQIIGCSLLHKTLFFFHFFFTFEINSLVWSIYWKTFFLFLLKHYLNNMYEISDGLEGVGWDNKDQLGSWPWLI